LFTFTLLVRPAEHHQFTLEKQRWINRCQSTQPQIDCQKPKSVIKPGAKQGLADRTQNVQQLRDRFSCLRQRERW